jgi:hypothetical protein
LIVIENELREILDRISINLDTIATKAVGEQFDNEIYGVDWKNRIPFLSDAFGVPKDTIRIVSIGQGSAILETLRHWLYMIKKYGFYTKLLCKIH